MCEKGREKKLCERTVEEWYVREGRRAGVPRRTDQKMKWDLYLVRKASAAEFNLL
jgi:hypothetical protein